MLKGTGGCRTKVRLLDIELAGVVDAIVVQGPGECLLLRFVLWKGKHGGVARVALRYRWVVAFWNGKR